MRIVRTALLSVVFALAGCQAPGGDARSLAALPPLDCAVMVTGGAFLSDGGAGTAAPGGLTTFLPASDQEAVPLTELVGVLEDGAVFRRVMVDPDPQHRYQVLSQLRPEGAGDDPALREWLQQVRDQGCDWLLVVEQLQNGAIEGQGINGRWPLTLAFWLLVGLGALIPDHTFESRATLRVTLRDLQTGRVIHDPPLNAGPVDLSLVERGSFLGFAISLLVPPFWVSNDDESVRAAVREFTQRRLLVSLARDLKSPAVRQRLQERSVASVQLALRDGKPWLLVDARESLSQLQVRQDGQTLLGPQAEALQAALLGSLLREENRFQYEAPLKLPLHRGLFQVLLATIAGNVVSATFTLETP
jgi:hypothetical protein